MWSAVRGVMTVDDHPIFRDGLAALLAWYRDLGMPVMGGAQATEAITSAFPDARIIALKSSFARCIAAIASSRQPSPEARRIHTCVELTDRELDVLALMAKGQSTKEIAESIGRTEATVKVHVLHILSKLGVDDRTAAITVALKREMIHLT